MHEWLVFAGLIVAFLGSVVVAWGSMTVTDRDAVALTVSRWAADDDDENLQTPAAQALLGERRWTRWGVGLIAAGFLLQAMGSWPRLR